MDGASGLAVGDRVIITFLPAISVSGRIAWSIWHKAGLAFSSPLAPADPLYAYLAKEAAKFATSEKPAE